MNKHLILFCLFLLISQNACLPLVHPPGDRKQVAQLSDTSYLTEDGSVLPLRTWLPKEEPQAVLIALHGFNDYSHFFAMPGEYLSQQGIACFAYDQRGFGAAPQRGLWAGSETYAQDLQVFLKLLKQRYSKQPIYLLGESMGGAIVINAMGQTVMPEVDGVILSAPALWARSAMPWYQTSLLWLLAHSMPWLTLTGGGVHVTASDNIDMLRALGRDPLVIKETRVDSIYGLADLMDTAYASAPLLQGKLLMLYGEKDEIIPKKPTYEFAQQLLASKRAGKTVAIYEQGYHMLLRDLQAATTWQDIIAWIKANPIALPSGADNHAKQVLSTELD